MTNETAAAAPPKSIKEGFLVRRSVSKHAGLFHNWKKQWFILDENKSLSYFGGKDQALKGQILLTYDTTVSPSTKRSNCLKLTTPYVTMHLQATKGQSVTEWEHAIQSVCRTLKFKKSKGRLSKIAKKARENKANQHQQTGRGTHTFSAMAAGTHTKGGMMFEVDTRYEFIRRVGEGAYGIVVAALDTQTGKYVAIKKIRYAFAHGVDAKRILREIKLGMFLKHPNISYIVDLMRAPPIIPNSQEAPLNNELPSTNQPSALASQSSSGGDASESTNNSLARQQRSTQVSTDILENNFDDLYIVLDLMDADLHKIIYSTQELSDEHISFLMFQLLSGMQYLHSANVIHRDLKPSNVLVNAACQLRVCDFGLSRGMDEDNLDDLTAYVVTRWYRAPELILERGKYTSAIDMWSVGCIFAEMITRRPLFPGKDYLSQIDLICDLRGKPNLEEQKQLCNASGARYIQQMEYKEKRDLRTVEGFANASDDALDLLDKLLALNPQNRISAADALKHKFVEAYWNEPTQLAPKPFPAESFEKSKMTEKLIRSAIMEQIREFRGDMYDLPMKQYVESLKASQQELPTTENSIHQTDSPIPPST